MLTKNYFNALISQKKQFRSAIVTTSELCYLIHFSLVLFTSILLKPPSLMPAFHLADQISGAVLRGSQN